MTPAISHRGQKSFHGRLFIRCLIFYRMFLTDLGQKSDKDFVPNLNSNVQSERMNKQKKNSNKHLQAIEGDFLQVICCASMSHHK